MRRIIPSIAAKLSVRIVGWDEERHRWVVVEQGQEVSQENSLTVVDEGHIEVGSDPPPPKE